MGGGEPQVGILLRAPQTWSQPWQWCLKANKGTDKMQETTTFEAPEHENKFFDGNQGLRQPP